MAAQEYIQNWLTNNVNPDRIYTGGVFDPIAPPLITRMLLKSARADGFSDEEIHAAQPNLVVEVAQAYMRVVKDHKDG